MRKNFFNLTFTIKITALILALIIVVSAKNSTTAVAVEKMPFYSLNPQELVLRSKFYTSYSSSSEERKNNIQIASSLLNKTIVDVGGEFSFNLTVGPRTVERGFKTSKIIVNGEFVDGVGGGVCQVSTTLYNAILLAGLTVTEYHPHSLPVSYVAPSFDAMVSYNFADLKFINQTQNPILIFASATDKTVTVEIYGQPSVYTYSRQSIVTEQIPPPKEQEIDDDSLIYPELYEGQKKVIKYSQAGLKSEGYLVKLKNGKPILTKKIRKDVYNATRGLIISGKAPLPILPDTESQIPNTTNIILQVKTTSLTGGLHIPWLAYS